MEKDGKDKELDPRHIPFSLFKGFHKRQPSQRLQLLQQLRPDLNSSVFQQLPSPLAGNRIIENFIGYVPIPIGIATNFVVNNITYLVPMAIEEPSVIAAASSAAQFIAKHGGFRSSSSDSKMIGQIQMIGMEDLDLFVYQVKEIEPKLRDRANLRLLSMAARGGGLKEIRTRRLAASAQVRQFYKPEEMAVVELIIDVCDAMGANIVNTVCEDLGQYIEQQVGARHGLRILTNYCTERTVVSKFEVPLADMMWKGVSIATKILEAQDFAERDVHRAATHNKGVMNGIDAVLIATGQDWRAVEAACHTYASRKGKYEPLTRYDIKERDGHKVFVGTIEVPMSVGTVGGSIGKQPVYRQTLQIMGDPKSRELSQVVASVGLAQNFAALRAMVVQGIQKGHMRLHLRDNESKL